MDDTGQQQRRIKPGPEPAEAPREREEWPPRGTGSREEEGLVGTVLAERYRLHRLLARGGMGAVYAGSHLLLHIEVAVKVVAFSGRPAARQTFLREARACSAARHPNVVQTFDCGLLDSGAGFLVMEYLSGSSLAQRLAAGPLDLSTACRIALHVARGLAAIHSCHIVHRDVKPSNIWLLPDGDPSTIKILDFGIAVLTDARQTPRGFPASADTLVMPAGTPAYMSPEQCLGQPLDQRSDIYSFGCMLYEMLCGRTPFSGATASEIMEAHVIAPIDDVRSPHGDRPLPPALCSLVLRMLAKDPRHRPRSMADLERELAVICEALELQGTSARLRGDGPGAARRSRLHGPDPSCHELLLRPLIALILALMSVRAGRHIKPVLVSDPPLPRPPCIAPARFHTSAPRPPTPAAPDLPRHLLCS